MKEGTDLKKPLKTSTIIVTILTIIACGIGFDFYNHSLSLDTLYTTGVVIIIFLLFSTRITDKSKDQNTSKPTKKQIATIFWSSIFIVIILFIFVSIVTTGHVSIQNLILFTCLIIFGGFVIISILSKKGKI
jgi:archaellum biogenesis protein FlaJ (TadC family)